MRYCLLALLTVAGGLAEDGSKRAAMLEQRAAELLRAGEYSQAEHVQRKALRQWEEVAKEREIDLVKPNVNLAQIYVAEGKLGAAERHAQLAWNLQDKTGVPPGERARLIALLARICFAQGDYRQAADLQSGVVRLLETTVSMPGEDALAIALNDLGMIHAAKGELSSARIVLERSLRQLGTGAIRSEVLGNLALVCFRAGDQAAADSFYREAIGRMEEALGPDHPHIGFLLAEHARLLQKAGRAAEATSARLRAKAILASYRPSGQTVDFEDLRRGLQR
jgi:tetratricopeptide (TPR) repeat protein